MSIWISGDPIGLDHNRRPHQRGTVLSYAEGFSNHHPDLTGEHERPAEVDTAHIPSWCVPGNCDDEESGRVGRWLRLSTYAPQAEDHWTRDEAGRPTVREATATVVMDEAAVRALVADLTEWLDIPKVAEGGAS